MGSCMAMYMSVKPMAICLLCCAQDHLWRGLHICTWNQPFAWQIASSSRAASCWLRHLAHRSRSFIFCRAIGCSTGAWLTSPQLSHNWNIGCSSIGGMGGSIVSRSERQLLGSQIPFPLTRHFCRKLGRSDKMRGAIDVHCHGAI